MLYILLTLTIGLPIMLAEFGIGRSTKRSVIGAVRAVGGRGWTPLGYLFVLLVGLTVWAATLDGGAGGYRFYLAPGIGELFSLETFSDAAGQAFYWLSLGMGAMLTFSSYLSRDESLPRSARSTASPPTSSC